jgi:hypothetical protein
MEGMEAPTVEAGCQPRVTLSMKFSPEPCRSEPMSDKDCVHSLQKITHTPSIKCNVQSMFQKGAVSLSIDTQFSYFVRVDG